MKKKLLIGLLGVCLLTGCGNRMLVDSTYTFDRAIISMPDGTVVEGKVDSWIDFDNSDQVQIEIDGVIYWTHSTNVVLISGVNE